MKGIIIKRILSLLLIIILGGCKTTQLPEVSTKLEPVFKEHKKIYKKQNVWKHVQWEYKYGRKVIDSIFTKYNLHDSDELYIITSTDALANYSLEIKSVDKNIHLSFYEYRNLMIKTEVDLSYNPIFKELVGGNFIEFINSKTQEELENCHKTAPIINNEMILFTHYNKGNIIVKRFATCNYAEYFNLERAKEEDWE